MLHTWSSYDEYSALIETGDISDDARVSTAAPGSPGQAGCLCLAPCLPLVVLLPATSLDFAKRLALLTHTAVEPTPQQEVMLDAYARVILDDIDPGQVPYPADLWILCGFQSKNPWTDFRGAGELGVKTFAWFAENHAENLKLIATDLSIKSDRRVADLIGNEKYYPYSASFINVIVSREVTTNYLLLQFTIYNYCRIGTDLAGAMTDSTGLLKDNKAVVVNCNNLFVDDLFPKSKHQGSKINVMRLLAILAQDNESSEVRTHTHTRARDLFWLVVCTIRRNSYFLLHKDPPRLAQTSVSTRSLHYYPCRSAGNGATLMDFESVLNKLPVSS